MILYIRRLAPAFVSGLRHSTSSTTIILNAFVLSTGSLLLLLASRIDSSALIVAGTLLSLTSIINEVICGQNLILLYRLLLLGSFGVFAAPQFVLAPGDSISPTMVEFQTPGNAAILALMTSLALSGSCIAWSIAMWGCADRASQPLPSDLRFGEERTLSSLFLVLGVVFCFIHSRVSKIVLLGAFNYGNASSFEANSQFLTINTWGFAGLCCFINVLIFEFRHPQRSRRSIIIKSAIIGAVIMYAFILRGYRSETVTFAATAALIYWQLRRHGELTRKLVLTLSASCIALAAFTLVLGAIRGTEDISEAKAAALRALNPTSKTNDLTTGVEIPALNWLPSVGSAPLVMCVIGLHADGVYDYMLGRTLISRIRNTLPRIINPLREDDVALIYDKRFGVVSTGGMPELAEGYLNFGPWGALLLSAPISLVIFWFYRMALDRDSYYHWCVCAAVIMSVIYSNLYGIGDVYKAALTGILLNSGANFVYRLLVSNRRGFAAIGRK